MIHGVNDWTHGKPAKLPAEQCVIDDVEQHCGNGPIQNLLQGQVSYLGVGKGCQHERQDELCSLLHWRPCTKASLPVDRNIAPTETYGKPISKCKDQTNALTHEILQMCILSEHIAPSSGKQCCSCLTAADIKQQHDRQDSWVLLSTTAVDGLMHFIGSRSMQLHRRHLVLPCLPWSRERRL